MTQPIHFPNQYDVIREETERFNRLSLDHKFEMLQDMIQTGLELIELSPSRQFEQASRDANESLWQQAHNRIASRIKS